MGGVAELLLPEPADESLARDVFAGLAAIDARFNAWKPGELTELNAALQRGRTVAVSPVLRELLVGAAKMERASLGHFNAALGALVAAWGFHADRLPGGAPPAAALRRRLLTSKPSLLAMQWRGERVFSLNPAVQVDLGGYAKGAAIEWAFARLLSHGVRDALLDLNGNLAAMGQLHGRPWRVGIRDPLGPGLAGTVLTRGHEAVITSGHYERYREWRGERFGHVLQPAAGAPAAELVSVTVVHADAAVADAAATALLAAGAASWPDVARAMGLAQVLVIDRDGRSSATPAMRARLAIAG
jgi:thiamine biosynthesis lipoprotein